MDELLADLAPEFGPSKVFRPYRDLRFSPDKSPYKTAMGAMLADGGYVQLSAAGLAAGSGMYQMAPDQLERYRRAVADDATGEGLRGVIAAVEEHGITVSGHDSLKSAPRGYPKDHPRADLLRHKGLTTWRDWPVEPWLGTAAARDELAGFFRASRPLCDWLDAHVGETQAAPRR